MWNLTRPLALSACCSLVGAAASLPTPATAAQVAFVASGQFDDTAPTSFFSAPLATWSVRYVMDLQPAVDPSPFAVLIDFYTSVQFGQFSYWLNGVQIAESAQSVAFYNAANGGGADFAFSDRTSGVIEPLDAVAFWGPQAYSGAEDAPTLLPGSYQTFLPGQPGSFAVVVDEVLYWQPGATFALVPVPLAGTVWLLLPGLLALGWAGRRTRGA